MRFSQYFMLAIVVAVAIASPILWETYERKDCEYFVYVNHDYACGRTHHIDKSAYILVRNDLETYIEGKNNRKRDYRSRSAIP